MVKCRGYKVNLLLSVRACNLRIKADSFSLRVFHSKTCNWRYQLR